MMSKRNGRNRKPRRGQQQNRQSPVTNRLDRLIDLEKAQSGGTLVAIRDQPPLVLKRNKVFTMQRSFNLGLIGPPTGGVDTLTAYSFALTTVPDSGDFTGLYDQYRILQISVEFLPTSQSGGGPLLTAIDYDDAGTPPSVNELLSHSTLMKVAPGSGIVRTFQPRIAVAAYSGVFTSFAQLTSPWLDNASNGILHYGLKAAIPTVVGNANQWFVSGTMVIQCRNVV
jgi:hypothetical protein